MNIADQLSEQAAINQKIGANKAPVQIKKPNPVNIVVKSKKSRGKKS